MGVAISFVSGKGALAHNNREFIHDNVDESRVENNINYKEESLKSAYEKCFGRSVREYNKKQTRNDRKIKNYMQKIKDSGNNEKLFYENVVQIGDKYSHGFGSDNEQEAIDILDEYAKSFQDRNPNLYIFNMKMHLDEASPHLHIDYIPVATGYKRGLGIRNSLTKAHANMGISRGTGRNDNSTMKWQENERWTLKKIAKKHNLEIINKKTDRKHLTVDEYKIYAEEIEKQFNRFNKLSINISPAKIPFTDRLIIKEKELEGLSNSAKTNHLADKTISKYAGKLEGKEVELNLLADKLKERDMELEGKNKELDIELQEVKKLKNKYESLYEEQLNINEKVSSLKEENKILKSKVKKLEPLEQNVDDLVHIFKNQVKAISMLLYDDEEYAIDLPDKQKTLLKALDRYSQGWLRGLNRGDLADEVETKMGISKGIENEIKEIQKEMKKEKTRGGRGSR